MIIASYPRSGSTWLRFILCHLYYPNARIDFAFVNKAIPDIDHAEGMRASLSPLLFFKSHRLRHGQRILFLHRHVGDVLISEYWYKRKFHGDTRTLEEFLASCDYGREWREHIDFYFPCQQAIGFDELGNWEAILRILPQREPRDRIEHAIAQSSFDNLQSLEGGGFGDLYPSGDLSIRFIRDGRSGQWKELPRDLTDLLLEKNFTQLRVLGYL